MTSSRSTSRAMVVVALLASTDAFMLATPSFISPEHQPLHTQGSRRIVSSSSLSASSLQSSSTSPMEKTTQLLAAVATTAILSASLFLGAPAAFAEDELAAKYGGAGFDSSLVDQTCLVDKCSLQAKACLADDPSCRKGLTCTAKCMGDNSCITGCMARYGDKNLDNLLKCTIEDNDCIKIAILDGGADKFGEEPRSPAPTIKNFDYKSMEGSWYKVVGFNPNYDCYSCQRNTFSSPDDNSNLFISNNKLKLDVEFSMAHLLPDGSPPPPTNRRESVKIGEDDGLMYGSRSIGFNDYETHEVMVFDKSKNPLENLVLNRGSNQESTFARTAHSEGEMFGLKFWENWYVIGENDVADDQDFKFVYYNGKTRQNTYEGAFVYARNRDLSPESMKKVYSIAKGAGMNPDQFCKIRNGCFSDDTIVTEPATGMGSPSNPFRGILASTKVSQLLGVEPVAAEQTVERTTATSPSLQQTSEANTHRAWWYQVGDYLENPHRHFEAMDSLRITMEWPEDVKNQ